MRLLTACNAHCAIIYTCMALALAWAVLGSDTAFADDWADLTAGLNGQNMSINLGTPDNLVLRGSAFPVILAQDGTNSMVAAARVSEAGGKVVAFNKEAYILQCGNEASPSTALPCRLMVNALRWAAGVSATATAAGNATSFRLAVSRSVMNTAQLTAIKTAATALGFNITFPSGFTSNFLNDLSGLGSGATKIADVVLTTSYVSFAGAEKTAITNFVQQGGGLVLGGQAWSTGGNITLYAGNQLLAPFNCILWAGQYGDAHSITVATTAPNPVAFNADLSAKAFLDHLEGTAVLTADMLTAVSSTLRNAISQTSFTWASNSSSPSAALWASFGSALDSKLTALAGSWSCGKVDASNPANVVVAAYLAKRQTDLLPSQVTPLPCSATFPGAPGAGATPLNSATVTVNATFAGNYSGPMPPRGALKWLSTGLFAPAGQIITVTIPATLTANLKSSDVLGVQIGSHTDGISHKSSWCRLPYSMVQRWWFTPAANGNTVTAASGMGGLIYINVAWGNSFGPVDVVVSGALQAPFFFKGRTSEEEWRNSLRSSPVPWAELGSDKFVMTVPSTAVAKLDNPQAVVDTWDKVLDGYADLSGFSRDRPRAERIVLDCDISAGWMHSGYPIMAYSSVADLMMLPNLVGRENGWGFFHELGHNHQYNAWTLPNQGETTCNLFSVWAMENIMKINRTARMTNRAAEQAAYFASGSFPANFDSSTGLYQLMQLQENAGDRGNYTSGWDFFARFLKRMQQLDGTAAVANDAAKIQTWVIETSKTANKNLAPFYKTWKFPVSAEAEAAVAALPALDFDAAAPCGQECSNCCLPADMSPSAEVICRQTVPQGYTFYSQKESSGNDVGQAAGLAGNWTKLADACSANPYCIAINTNGYMKYALLNETQWTTRGTVCEGLLVKTGSQTGPGLPSTLSAAAMLTFGGLCAEVQNGNFANGQRLALTNCTGSNRQVFRSGSGSNNNRIETVYAPAGGSAFCLDVYNSGTAAGTSVTLFTCTTNNNQKWALDSKQRLVPAHATGMCLDTEGSSLSSGARLVINPCSTAPSQTIVAQAAVNCTGSPGSVVNGTFFCCTSTATGVTCAGQCNSDYAGSPSATCWNGQYSVTGDCALAGPIPQPSMLHVSNLCVQVNGNNANSQRLILANCTGSNSQLFRSGTGSNTKRLETVYGGVYCLDVNSGSSAAGTAIILWSCSTTANNQKWTQDSLQRWTPAHAPGKCLDTEGGSLAAGAKLVINTCSDALSQKIVASLNLTATATSGPTGARRLLWR